MNPYKSLSLIAVLSLLVMSLTVLPLEESEASEMKVVYDNFDDGTLGTNTGGAARGMSPSGEDAPTINFTADSKEGDYALSINYDFSSGSWEGYWSFFNAGKTGSDVSSYTDIRMWVKGAHGGENFKIELKDASNNQSSVYITAADGFSSGASTSWQELVIPLSDFSGVSISQLKQVNIIFDQSPNSGTVYVDLIRFTSGGVQGLKGSINVEVTPKIFMPEVLSVSPSETSWDPGGEVMIETTVRDNDSLRDLENVAVKAYQSATGIPTDNLRLSYTFWFDPADNSWHSSLGDGYINPENCSRPTDLSENQGTYEFAVSLDPTAVPAAWSLRAEATDENTQTGNLENSSAFSVNVYTKVGLDRHALNFSGMQGERASPVGGPLTANVSTNKKFHVRVRLSGPLTAGSYTIPMSNISADGITLTDTYRDVRTGCGYGKGVGEEIEWGLTIPESQEPGNYTTTFYVNVAH